MFLEVEPSLQLISRRNGAAILVESREDGPGIGDFAPKRGHEVRPGPTETPPCFASFFRVHVGPRGWLLETRPTRPSTAPNPGASMVERRLANLPQVPP